MDGLQNDVCIWNLCNQAEWCHLLTKTKQNKTKLELHLPYDPAIPLLNIYLKKTKTLLQKDIYTPIFIAALLQQLRYGSNLDVHQQLCVWCVYKNLHIAYIIYAYIYAYCMYTLFIYLCIKQYQSAIKNEILLFEKKKMELEGIMFSEISHTEKYKYYILPLICGICKTK